ncbi:MAG TPA: DUF2171 domain-containing protein [Caulobacteraceae bacterium]|nr:DUF2171 domain-containing protein [Caulobacteraceae bacterium]
MADASQIREHMEIVSSDDRHVGRVDHVKGSEIELAKMDVSTLGAHRLIPLSWVDFIDDKVHLNLTHDAAREHWTRAH